MGPQEGPGPSNRRIWEPDMADEHKIGSMDITEQEKTFAGFMTFTKWTVIAIIALLILLALFRA